MPKNKKSLLKVYQSLGEAEAKAAAAVVRSGTISGFFGSPGPEYYGGPLVQKFEQAWAKRFQVPHAVSVNSATSGLMAALGAIGLKPGDEVIVPPLTMSATVAAPLVYGGVPVFADVEEETGCLSVAEVKAAITPKTRVIMAVNLFGHPARLRELRKLADQRGLFLIEDNAQGPLAEEDGELAGTIGHIGVFSLNYHKHIHTGEGGMCVTGNPQLARRMQLIRNHAENAVADYGTRNDRELIGFNWRLTEIQAAIGLVQLKKIDRRVNGVVRAAERLSKKLRDVSGFIVPQVRSGCRSSYYVWMGRLDMNYFKTDRETISRALTEAGVPHMAGYVKPLYELPVFSAQRKIVSCPVAERLTKKEWLGLEMCRYDFTNAAVDAVAAALKKVLESYAR